MQLSLSFNFQTTTIYLLTFLFNIIPNKEKNSFGLIRIDCVKDQWGGRNLGCSYQYKKYYSLERSRLLKTSAWNWNLAKFQLGTRKGRSSLSWKKTFRKSENRNSPFNISFGTKFIEVLWYQNNHSNDYPNRKTLMKYNNAKLILYSELKTLRMQRRIQVQQRNLV